MSHVIVGENRAIVMPDDESIEFTRARRAIAHPRAKIEEVTTEWHPEIGRMGLDGLVLYCESYRYPSIAIPALGCGLGQLEWGDVLPLIQDTAKVLNERGVTVELYAPAAAR